MTSTPEARFARRLREERRAARMTQADLAARVSELRGSALDSSAITRLERAERSVRLDDAVYLAEALGVPLASLLSDGEEHDRRLAQLRFELGHAKWREAQALEQLEQARSDAAAIEGQIAELEQG